MTVENVLRRIEPRRRITGMSAVLLPFHADNRIDFDSFERNLERTFAAGLAPAVNMDTGYANLISAEDRTAVLQRTKEIAQGKKFVAGAFIETLSGEPLALYREAVEEIQSFGGTPIIFQSTALKQLNTKAKIQMYRDIGEACDSFLAFELGEMFAPFGQIYHLDTMQALMEIPNLVGAKHSSLSRELEWQRLELRDRVRPDFLVLTGNDLAIDLVMYGSDYLLGLSAFSPEAFALRDKLWEQGDAGFYALNDLIQYLGFLAFRPPVPAYKHNCAQFLKLRGRIESDTPHAKAATRPQSDVEILRDISDRLDAMVEELAPRVSNQEQATTHADETYLAEARA